MSRHLIDIGQLDDRDIEELLERGARWRADDAATAGRGLLAGRGVGLLFHEPSTRTRCSFELAARRLGADIIDLDIDTSAAGKGENLADTAANLAAMGVQHFVLRHGNDQAPGQLAASLPAGCSLINAGAGHTAHPTQALLDALTLRRHLGGLEGRTVSILGDIRHSRVAASAVALLPRLGVAELRLAGPRELLPETPPPGCRLVADRTGALEGADVVMALRIQRERMAATRTPDPDGFHREWGLTRALLERHAPEAALLHPGPVNRGVELSDDAADGPQSLILEQVANGVALRMAVLEWLDTTQGQSS